MTIDPKWGLILNIVATICAAIAAGTISFVGIPPEAVSIIKTTALDVSILLGIVNSVLHFYSPASTTPVTQVAKAVMWLTIGLVGFAMYVSPASAAPSSAPVPVPVSRPAAAPKVAGKLTSNQAQANPVALIQTFTVSDLQAALADAQAQTPPDTVAAACYTALIPIVQSGVANPLPAGPGLFQAVQKVRDARALLANLQSPTGPLAALNTACAPLVLDAQTTLIQLGIMTGAVIGTGGAGLALPFALPIPLP